MAQNLEFHGLKDPWSDNCEHCGVCHKKTMPIDGYGDFTFRSQCNECCEAEDGLGKLNHLISKTRGLLHETPNTPKNSELREKLKRLEKEQLRRRDNLIKKTKDFFAGRHNPEPIGATSRLPYKEE